MDRHILFVAYYYKSKQKEEENVKIDTLISHTRAYTHTHT